MQKKTWKTGVVESQKHKQNVPVFQYQLPGYFQQNISINVLQRQIEAVTSSPVPCSYWQHNEGGEPLASGGIQDPAQVAGSGSDQGRNSPSAAPCLTPLQKPSLTLPYRDEEGSSFWGGNRQQYGSTVKVGKFFIMPRDLCKVEKSFPCPEVSTMLSSESDVNLVIVDEGWWESYTSSMLKFSINFHEFFSIASPIHIPYKSDWNLSIMFLI